MIVETIKFANLQNAIQFRIGKNKLENTKLIENSKPEDIWFHILNIPSCHVVVTLPENIDKKTKKTILKWGCIFCKKYSKITNKCHIMYTEIKNVNCTENNGEVEVEIFKTWKF